MKELKLLKSLWQENKAIIDKKTGKEKVDKKTGQIKYYLSVKTSKELIVPAVYKTYKGYDLKNEHWYYTVNGAFRNALGIELVERSETRIENIPVFGEDGIQLKDEKTGKLKVIRRKVVLDSWHEWVQTPFLSFSLGDVFHSKCGGSSIQIEDAYPMNFNKESRIMNQGMVRYKTFDINDGRYTIKDLSSCNQMEFLAKLIYGSEVVENLNGYEKVKHG